MLDREKSHRNGCLWRGTISDVDPADFYSGIVVDAYSKLKSSTFEAEPYASFVASHGEPGLEIGCGDGQPILDLCASGLDVDGVDSSLDMVNRCREKRGPSGASHAGTSPTRRRSLAG